jgi:hypothetical protein
MIAGQFYPDAVEAPSEPLVVKARREQSSVDRPQDFVNAVAEDEATVINRHARLSARDKAAIHIDYIFCLHALKLAGLVARDAVLAAVRTEDLGKPGCGIGERSRK